MLHQQILRPGEQEDHVGAGRDGGGGGAGDGGQPPAVCQPDPGGVQPAGPGTEDRHSEGQDPAVQGSLLPVVAQLQDSQRHRETGGHQSDDRHLVRGLLRPRHPRQHPPDHLREEAVQHPTNLLQHEDENLRNWWES